MQVRSVTTARGENPSRIDQRPNTGNVPRKTADDKAARIPTLCRLLAAENIFFTVIELKL